MSAAAAQGVSLLVSLSTSLLVPKVLGVEEFGYWQLFIFYFNYVGAFHLGLNDGIYLIKGGQRRNELDKPELTSQFAFGCLFQSLFSLVVVIAVVAMQQEPERLFVLIACAVLMPIFNAGCFFQYLLQAIDETRTYSKSVMVDRGLLLALLILLVLLGVKQFEIYVYAFAVGKVAQLVYCLIKSNGLLQGPLFPLANAAKVSLSTMSVGIKLMLANLASTLILGMMRFAIDGYWGIEVFGKVSLALSMANFFLTFVTQTTMVLFPTLHHLNEANLRRFFSSVQNMLEVALPCILLLYLPVKLVLCWWLPDYAASFDYLALLLPLCLFDGKMNALYSTVFKVRRKESTLFVLNVATMALSAAVSFFGAAVLHNLNFVILGGTASIIMRSTVSCAILSKDVLGEVRLRWGEILLSVIFVVTTIALPSLASLAIMIACYAAYLYLERDSLTTLLTDIKAVRNKFRSEESSFE